MRCVTPVRLKSCHSSFEIARWSPTASAARRRPQHAQDAIADRLARAFDQVEEIIPRAEKLRPAPLAHVSRRADAALEQPGLVVEAVRIDVAVRAAQPHGQEPSLAGMDRAAEDRGRVFIGGAAIPGQQELSRQMSVRRGAFHRLDVELEAHAALAGRRQARHHPDHLQVAPFELRREPPRHPLVREQRRPQEAEREGGERNQPRLPVRQEQKKRKDRPPRERRQHGLPLQQSSARCKGESREGHLQ
jgi:hypothetical protein